MLAEIVVLNIVLTLAMLAMPLDVLGGGNPENAYTLHRDDMLRAIAEHYVGPAFAAGSAIVFALLLLSAANTAITDLVSIQFMMSRDRELPAPLGLLNSFGMPVLPLIAATAVPVAVLIAVSDVEKLADLYAIGVVGAVAINLGSCATNPKVELSRFERVAMTGLAALMVAVWITVAYEKPHALIFALSVLGVGLTVRYIVRSRAQVRGWILAELGYKPPAPAAGPVKTAEWTPIAPPKRILAATPGRVGAFRFALAEAKVAPGEARRPLREAHRRPVAGAQRPISASIRPPAGFSTLSRRKRTRPASMPRPIMWSPGISPGPSSRRCLSLKVDVIVLPVRRHGPVWRAVKGDVVSQRHKPSAGERPRLDRDVTGRPRRDSCYRTASGGHPTSLLWERVAGGPG